MSVNPPMASGYGPSVTDAAAEMNCPAVRLPWGQAADARR